MRMIPKVLMVSRVMMVKSLHTKRPYSRAVIGFHVAFPASVGKAPIIQRAMLLADIIIGITSGE
jgi:hypothetical protein